MKAGWQTPAFRLEPRLTPAFALSVAALLCAALGLCWWSSLPGWACALASVLACAACCRELTGLNRRWGALRGASLRVRAVCFDAGGWWLELSGGDRVPAELAGPPLNGRRIKAALLHRCDSHRRDRWRAPFRLCVPVGGVPPEQWRRLSLALDYGSSTVSAASAAGSG